MHESTDPMAPAVSRLREVVLNLGVHRGFLYEVATGFLEANQGQIGYAILKHATDILGESPEIEEEDLACECYRRTFFDSTYAELYGTEDYLMETPERAMEMVEHMEIQHRCQQQGTPVHDEATGTH